MEDQIILSMVQGGILHQHGCRRAFMGCYAVALINSTVLHTKATAVQVRHGIDPRRAGIEDFFRRCRTTGFGICQ